MAAVCGMTEEDRRRRGEKFSAGEPGGVLARVLARVLTRVLGHVVKGLQ